MTKEEMTICKIYLEDIDKTHDCNEYKLLMALLEQQPCDDCVSRQAVLDLMQLKMGGKELYKAVYELPPVTPTHGTCNDCNLWCKDRAIDGACFCSSFHTHTGYEFYCKEFEKRGNKVGWSSLENVREKVERGAENDSN